jgi:choline dehydrogenase-like flavoprotein
MFVDVSSFEDSHVERAEICILGSGPAGMALARKLTSAGRRVMILEAGGLDYDPESQDLYIGTTVSSLPYYDLDITRLRMFGGSSGHWGGACRPLDARDFQEKSLHPGISWPIEREDLDPWMEDAANVLGVEPQFEDAELTDDMRLLGYRWSQRRFGFDWYDWAAEEPNLRVCLGSAAVNLVPGGRGIRAVEVASGSFDAPRRWQVEAETVVVAMGGIETSRFLLWANEQNGDALFPATVPIGRYWMEHPEVQLGEALLTERGRDMFRSTELPTWRAGVGELMMALKRDVQAREDLLNANLKLLELAYPQTEQMVADLLCVAPGLGQRMMDALGRNLVCGVRFSSMCEQAPHEDNRVVLGASLDPLGIPRVELHWRIDAVERHSVAQSARLFAADLAAMNMGRVRLAPWVSDDDQPIGISQGQPAHHHHMGGARMGTNPMTSVVDPNQKVHGVDNLYVAGSAVFPTGGFANPTFTIVQLSLRLADHLAGF